MFSTIKTYLTSILVGLASIGLTFTVLVIYDSLIDDPAVRRAAVNEMVSKADHAAIQAQLLLEQQERKILEEALENSLRLSSNLRRDKEQLVKDAEKKISEDTSEDGCTVTQEDIDWSNR